MQANTWNAIAGFVTIDHDNADDIRETTKRANDEE
jgi:hypothetical protein